MKAVYYICNNKNWGHVSARVWELLEKEGFLKNKTDITFDSMPVYKYINDNGNEFYFVSTKTALCLDYKKYLPDMNKYFNNFDMSAMVTWHEGPNSPQKVLTVHSLGDLNSGIFGPINTKYMHNLLRGYKSEKDALGLEDYMVVTEATHWSGAHSGDSDAALLIEYNVPMVDIEVGSEPESWENDNACLALARALLHVFDDDGKKIHNILCVGGVHFETNYSDAAFLDWGDNECFGVSHILANQWLVSGEYENENGFNRACDCVDSIEGGIEAIAFHDKLKGCYKDLVRKLGEYYNVPILKHQKLRKPEEIEW
ncbi:MAG: D-aminoacyl-tRNA deacylase [Candidatus Metalachnospira sp.]|nr:D-aminoacyl-tRNA deacylase [Candidatus Metalachnospira sp.]